MATTSSQDPPRIVDIDPAKCHAPPGNRPVTADSVADLVASIGAGEQLVAAIVYPHPDRPGEFMAADGNRRAMAMRILGRMLKAVVLPEAPSAEELLRVRVTTNYMRKNSTAYELAADIQAWMSLKNANQKAAAVFFGISEASVSKALNKARNAVPVLVEAEQNGTVVPDVARLLATLPPDQQPVALAHVIANAMTRDQCEGYIAQLKHRKPKEPPPVEVKDDSGAMLKFPASWTWQRIIDLAAKYMDAAKRGAKVEGLTVSALPSLLKG